MRIVTRTLLGAAVLLLVAVVTLGCSIVLETETQNCRTDADCARHPNAVCDNARRLCVARQPYGGAPMVDGGGPTADGGEEETGPAMCQLSFDNAARIRQNGPDGGLRPLPEVP